jgi:hypothetical protein
LRSGGLQQSFLNVRSALHRDVKLHRFRPRAFELSNSTSRIPPIHEKRPHAIPYASKCLNDPRPLLSVISVLSMRIQKLLRRPLCSISELLHKSFSLFLPQDKRFHLSYDSSVPEIRCYPLTAKTVLPSIFFD